MSAVRDNWERLLVATLRREHLRYLSRLDSVSTTDSGDSFRLASPFPEASPDLQKFGYSFSYEKIRQATNSFSEENLIRRGSSGDFYRSDLVSPPPMFWNSVVVKRIDLKIVSNQEAYFRELAVLSKVSDWDSKFFTFFGQCLERKEEKFFVYNACNGDLSNSLFKKKATKAKANELWSPNSLFKKKATKAKANEQPSPSLDWVRRMKIARGTAAALAYLHQQSSPPPFHGDVQASSIFLDNNFEVRLGSLGSSAGHQTHDQTSEDPIFRELEMGPSDMARANDVYCFGKILVELATGKLGISATSNATGATGEERLEAEFLSHVKSEINKEVVTKILDPTLVLEEDLLEEVWSVCIVSKYCLNPQPEKRPQITQILTALEHPLEFLRAAAKAQAHPQESWPDAALHQHIVS